MLQLQHDLEVHQIELELQNEELRASQAELQTALARYTDLYDFAPVGYLTLKPDGEIRQLNFTATTLLGAKRSDLVNKRLGLFVGLADRAAFAGFLKRVFAGQSQACEVTLESPAAAPPLIVRCEVSPTPSGLECRVIMTNITERWRADEALRVESERRRILFEQLPDGIVTVDPQTARFVEFNRVAHEQLGYSREEFSRLTLHDLEAPETAAETKARMAEANQTGSLDFETRHRTRPGEIRHVHVTSKRVNVQGQVVHQCVFRDITERKRIEEQLRQLSRAVEQSPASIVLTDLQGQIEYVNPKFTQISGYRLDEVRGQNPRVLKSGEMPPAQYARLWQVITSGGEWHGEFHNKRKNGELYWESASISPLMDAHGRITGFLGVKEDITARKQLEAKLRDSEHRLKSLIASMDDLVFVLDQDLRFEQFHQPAHQMLFVQPEQFEGKRLDEIGLPEPAFGCIHQAVGETLQTGNSAVATYRLDLPAGPAWFEMHVTALPTSGGTRPGVTCVVRDITTRKQAEAALRENEARLRAITDSAQDAILMMNPEGAISYWNPAAERIFGYPSAEALGQNLHTFLVPPRYHAAHQAALPEFGQTGQGPAVGKMTDLAGRRKDGQEIAVQLSLSAVQIEGRWHAVGILRDITERKQAEVALRESESRFRTVIESSSQGIFLARDMKFSYLNPAALRLLGATSPEQLIGQPVLARIHPSYHESVEKRDEQQGLAPLQEEVYLRLDGTPVPVEVAASPIIYDGHHAAVVFVQDITARKQAVAALHAEIERRRILFEQLPDGLLVIDPPTARFVEFNPAAHQQLGYSREEFARLTLHDLEAPETAAETQARIAEANQTGAVDFETRHRTRQGEIRNVHITAQLVNLQGQAVLQCVFRDITARKRIDEQLRQLSSAVEQSPASIVITNLQGQIEYANPKFTQVSGYRLDEVLGQTCRVLKSGAALPEQYAHLWQVITSGGEWHGEFLNKKKNGELYWEAASISPLVNAHGRITGFLGVKEDITLRKQMEVKLKEVAARFDQLAEQSRTFAWEVDAAGLYTYVSPVAELVLGYRPEELVGRHFYDLHPETGREAFKQAAFAVFAQQEQFVDLVNPVRTKAGGLRWVATNGIPLLNPDGTLRGYHGSDTDITARKRAEEEIRRQAALISSLLDSIPDMVFYKNTEGVYLGCNPIFVAFVGRPRNEIIGHTDYDLFDPEIADAFRDHDWQVMASCEPRHNEEWITYPDGRKALIDTLKSPYWGPDGALIGMLGISRDITARKQAEESLRQSESRFRTVIESSSLAIFVALDLKFSYLNPAALRLLGATTPAQLMGQPFLSRVHPSYHATIRERNAQVVGQQGLVPLLEEVYLRLDGTPVPVEVIASPIIYEGQPGAVVFVQDITERKRTHEALRAETERRHILFEQLPDGILVVDSQTARFVEFNTAAHQQLGYSRAEFARLTIHDVEAEETAAETKTHIAEVIQTGAVDFETRHRTRQGEIRDIHVTAQLVNVAGQAVHQCVWRDITERKRAEAELLHTLATERKLSALKTTFGTMVSHEFRTPLSTILGAAEMLEDFYASMPPEQQADYFGTIRREIQRLSGMLENVLLQGRLESGQVQFKPQATDVVAVCRDVLARVQLAFPKHPPVHFEADAPTHPTLADESLLECVLNNLLTNALKYSPTLTPVRLTVRRVGEEWEIQVRDQGLGIDEADQAFVFSAFRRGGNVGNIKGTGVGLYLVKKCAELQGGRVELRSQVGQGSTFVFTFPWRPAETAPAVTL